MLYRIKGICTLASKSYKPLLPGVTVFNHSGQTIAGSRFPSAPTERVNSDIHQTRKRHFYRIPKHSPDKRRSPLLTPPTRLRTGTHGSVQSGLPFHPTHPSITRDSLYGLGQKRYGYRHAPRSLIQLSPTSASFPELKLHQGRYRIGFWRPSAVKITTTFSPGLSKSRAFTNNSYNINNGKV